MGILNITPDSFSDGGSFFVPAAAVERARRMVEEGADIIDIGGESTRPGAQPVGVEEELRRVLPVVEAVAASVSVPISIDTYKAAVMREACARGAGLINDVTALRGDPEALATAVALGVPVCLMHMQGTPRDMQGRPQYADVVREVRDFLRERALACQAAGIAAERIVLDPGFGFGKNDAHNLSLLKHLDQLAALGYPVLAGLSRKSLIGRTLDLPMEERLEGGLALAVLAVWQGARIIRTHDVRATARAMNMAAAVLRAD
ncbi:MAG: dihydropteroate synthase [Pseudomonadota bacterium]